ncbi:MAG TPA: tRNA uracil 4-sulfurtransferase ThiI [Halanaerobiales bacterium]|nr:tRNA uracil 4-sulfurtransferase ThiI [Halanaerobiales bacterium]
MSNLYLIRYGEIGLKGENRNMFEDKLMSNIKKAVEWEDEGLNIYKTPGRIFLETSADKNIVKERLLKIPGLVSFSPVKKLPLDYERLKEETLSSAKEFMKGKGKITFRISARRSNKKFAYDSMELQYNLGEYVLESIGEDKLEVDLHQPDLDISVEIRKKHAYLYSETYEGMGGLPVGTTGNVGLMLSGGIDSPVAGYMGLKRGVKLIPIYFHSFPFTSDRAKEKVIDLAEVLAQYQNEINLHVVNFTEVLKEINNKCPDKLITIIMRRLMIKISEKIIEKQNGKAIITGESIGQVASQTLEAIHVTNHIPNLPILRPLLGLNKVQIVNLAKEIETYDISIQPYEDCCTVFVPQSPETRPTIEQVLEGEADLHIDDLIDEAIANVEVINIQPYS